MKNGFQILLVYIRFTYNKLGFKCLKFFTYFTDVLESIAKNDESISISELRWTTDFADIILKAIKELNYNLSDINLQLDTGNFYIKF